MPTRNTILKQLETDMKNNIKISRDYNTDPVEVRRGIHLWEDFTLKPAISYWCYTDEKFEGTYRQLFIHLYMFAKTDGLGNVDQIYDLAEDVEDFLYSSDWTYTDNTEIGNMVIYEGGVQDQASIAQLEITIKYSYRDDLV